MRAGSSLNDLVGSQQQRLGDCQAQCLGGLEVDDQFELGGQLTLHVRRRSRSCATAVTKSFTLIGLLWNASNPASMTFCRSSVITDAVMASTGISRVAGSARSWPSASIPSIPGSRMSI